MRSLILRGGPWKNGRTCLAILDYCEADVRRARQVATSHAGRAAVESAASALPRSGAWRPMRSSSTTGTPIDVPMLECFRRHWPHVHEQLILPVSMASTAFGKGEEKRLRFADWLTSVGFRGLGSKAGANNFGRKKFRVMSRSHPAVAPILRDAQRLEQITIEALAVRGSEDGQKLVPTLRLPRPNGGGASLE